MRIISHRKLKEFYEPPGEKTQKLLWKDGIRLQKKQNGAIFLI